ncbi:MAG TPA: thiamine pyrophosphate-dependent enzyme [Thermoanaerobaculia bacterium]|jgi:indolepyruvate decarboxylase|nr:thiamine pyrophosphate-dependent enzyme [Thermoanaerobaculia bacterium]
MAKPTITVAEYLIMRLKEFGAEHVFAVPGDYAGPFLSVVDKTKQITRVGVTNEWVAGYAADSYARLRGTGAVCLTYGVGTFGVLNALAGSYVEELPVALIVGSPSFKNRQVERHEGVLYHHSTGRLTADAQSVKNVVVAREVVRVGRRAPAQIDRALEAALTWRRPVYIEVYQNVWTETCRPPAGPLKAGKLPLSKRSLERAVDRTLARLEGATVPVIWAGVEVQRFGLQGLLEEVIRVTGLPWTTDLLGKSVLSEDHPGFKGVFDGASAVRNVMDLFDASNWVLGLGNLVTDDFAVWVEGHYDNMILAYNNSVRVGRKTFDDVPLAAFMERLVERLAERAYKAPPKASAMLDRVPTPGERARARFSAVAAMKSAANDDRVTYDRFFARMKSWVDEWMVLLADTSIALYSAAELPVVRRDGFIAQAAWNSIGYTPGGAVGVGYAEPGKRAVVFCGDGGFQEIVQAVSDIVRSGHDAVIFVFNNALYGIEQAFVDPYYFIPDKEGHRHPPEPFDLLHPWSYARLTEVFGGGWGVTVETMTELEEVLEKAKSNRGLSLIDLRIPQDSITLQMLQQAGVTPDQTSLPASPKRKTATAKKAAKPARTKKAPSTATRR